ncbi:MAG: hypothetical protein IPM64_18105 [Phycisphaerales bacterium]|nr:hypothetical protein [Phycisphaerales bacterium]
MRYDTTVTTAPKGLPLDLTHVKRHLAIYDTDRDGLLPTWIHQAWQTAEARTNRALLHTRYTLTLPAFPDGFVQVGKYSAYHGIVIPHVPLVSVVSVQYVDSDGATQTVSAADYAVNSHATPSFITPAYGVEWPTTREQEQAVIVTYDAGYASPFTANSTSNEITVTGPVTWEVDDPVRFSNSGGALPAPLAAWTTYYIKTAPGSGVYTLAATVGGSTVDLTDTGTGTHYVGEMPASALSWILLAVGEQEANREASAVIERGQHATMQFADHMLDPLKVWLP